MSRVAIGRGRGVTHPRRGAGGVDLGYTFPEWGGPPPGTYDPGLEAEVRSSERGLLDLIREGQVEGHRSHVDVGQKRREDRREQARSIADIQRQRGYSIEDAAYQQGQLRIDFTRAISDLGVARQQGGEDYERTLADMQHRYLGMATAQREAAVQRGTQEDAGTEAASGLVRGANQAHDKSLTDLAEHRAVDALNTREGRVRSDYAERSQRLQTELDRQLAGYGITAQRTHQDTRTALHALSRAAARAAQDRAEKLSKAKREQGIYATDVAQQAFYQAHQNNPHILFPGAPGAAGTPGNTQGAHGGPSMGLGQSHPLIGLSGGTALTRRAYPHSRPRYFGY